MSAVQRAPAPAARTRPRAARSRLGRSGPARVGAVIVGLYVVVALLAPLLAPPQGNCRRDLALTAEQTYPGPRAYLREVISPPDSCLQMPRVGFAAQPKSPASDAPLGRVGGYDIRYGLVWGTRTALFLGITVVCLSVLLGGAVGLMAGFFGGVVDNLLMRVTDVTFAFPGLVLVLVLVAALGPGLGNIILALSLVSWTSLARVVRSEVLRVREQEYVAAAQSLGASPARVALRHVLPGSLGPLSSIVVLEMGGLPIVAGALSFLGLGTPAGFADWGQLIALAQPWIQGPAGSPLRTGTSPSFPACASPCTASAGTSSATPSVRAWTPETANPSPAYLLEVMP